MFRTWSYYHGSRQLTTRGHSSLRFYSSFSSPPPSYTTPKPPPLPLKEQKEWEESMHRRQGEETAVDPNSHPDARKPVIPDFEGDANPVTGEIGGPKKEPLAWGANGEWTFGGRATDF